MFAPSQIIRRRELHLLYGGQEQGGISTPANRPFIMIFTGESGLSHGYEDGWTETGIFLYSGEGQLGDMSFVRGNRALRDHLKDGKDVHLFEYVGRGVVRYVGQMMVIGYHERAGVDGASNQRHTIVFEMVPAEDASEHLAEVSLDDASAGVLSDSELQQVPDRASAPAASPDDRRLQAHARTRAARKHVLSRANGVCEGCGNKAPFMMATGAPFLELHYLRRASDVGPESPEWIAALCPNCHRRVHHGSDSNQYNRKIAERIAPRQDS